MKKVSLVYNEQSGFSTESYQIEAMKTQKTEAGEMSQWLKEYTVLRKHLSLAPRTNLG